MNVVRSQCRQTTCDNCHGARFALVNCRGNLRFPRQFTKRIITPVPQRGAIPMSIVLRLLHAALHTVHTKPSFSELRLPKRHRITHILRGFKASSLISPHFSRASYPALPFCYIPVRRFYADAARKAEVKWQHHPAVLLHFHFENIHHVSCSP